MKDSWKKIKKDYSQSGLFDTASDNEKEIDERVMKLLQQAKQEGIEEAIRKIEKGIEWNVGTVLYENGKKYFVYNAEHISKLLSELKKK